MPSDQDRSSTTWRNPWVGNRYWEAPRGQRLVLVGESHYGEDHQLEDPDLTRTIVSRVAQGEIRLRFFTTVQRVVSDEDMSPADFWSGVAFFSYCQGGAWSRLEGAREEMWLAGDLAFDAQITALEPTHVIFFSAKCWTRLQASTRLTSRAPISFDGHSAPTDLYLAESEEGVHECRLLDFWYPAALGFGSTEWWRQFVLAFLADRLPPRK